MPRRSRPWKELKQELLRNPTFRQAYEELEPEYQSARAVIALRAARGLTQEEMATRAQIQRPVLSRIEGAQALPTIPTLGRLAAALNAKVEIRFVDVKNRPLQRVPSIRVGRSELERPRQRSSRPQPGARRTDSIRRHQG